MSNVTTTTTSTTVAPNAGDNKATLEVIMANTDAFFLIVIGIIIFFMQGGFAFLEAGAVRYKLTIVQFCTIHK